MAERTSETERVEFYRQNILGKTYAEIAQMYEVSLECVRYWCQKQKKGKGVKSEWHISKRGGLSQFDPEIVARVIQLREENPGWGAISIQVQLDAEKEEALKGKKLPGIASIGRFLRENPNNRRRPRIKQPELPKVVLTHVHQRWEIDFKVKIQMESGEVLQLHTVTDPFSGAYIGAYLYHSKPNTSRVPLQDVQSTLRACFTEWGNLPEEVQSDGEPVLVATPGELPTVFTLWLAGLGINHRRIAPARPTQNGSVERAHRTINEYCLQGHLHLPLSGLQSHLNLRRAELNTRYPSRAKGCGGQPPLSAHPELIAPLWVNRPEFEQLLFDLRKVDQHLAARSWYRKVGKTGQITLGGEHQYYSLGRNFARQSVLVRFDPTTREFVAGLPGQQDQFQEIKRWPARNLQADQLLWPQISPSIQRSRQLSLLLSCPQAVDWLQEKVNC